MWAKFANLNGTESTVSTTEQTHISGASNQLNTMVHNTKTSYIRIVSEANRQVLDKKDSV